MHIITKRDVIKIVLKRWKTQYPETSGEWYEITKQLEKLDFDTVDASVIVDIIGNNSWTGNYCEHCNKDCEKVIIISKYCERHEDMALCEECAQGVLNEMKVKRKDPKKLNCFLDGDSLCVVKKDFVDLQQSKAYFITLDDPCLKKFKQFIEDED